MGKGYSLAGEYRTLIKVGYHLPQLFSMYLWIADVLHYVRIMKINCAQNKRK